MTLTGTIPAHPARFTPVLLDWIAPRLAEAMLELDLDVVFDPFAGTGERLGALCDRLELTYDGVDIELWPTADPRVRPGDATLCDSYPDRPFVVCTSPVYLQGVSSDYKDGPTPNTKPNGRAAYGISLGRALHPDNLARTVVRSRADRGASDYYPAHSRAVRWWGQLAFVNVTSSMTHDWVRLLERHYEDVTVVAEIETPRVTGGLTNAADRDPFEVWIEASR
jgi:hypothetical protein